MTTVGIVVPAYRPDTQTLTSYVDALHDELQPATVRIEVDQPSERTLDALADTPAVVAASDDRRGKGTAITDGFDALDTDVLAFADADGSVPVSSLAAVIDRADDTLAVGSRRHPAAEVEQHQSVVRRGFGDVFASLARVLLDIPLHDFQCGAKALPQDVWMAVRESLFEPGFAWDVELIATVDTAGYDVVEVPVTWDDDPDSTVDTLPTAAQLLRALVTLRARRGVSASTYRTVRRQLPSSEPLVHRHGREGR
ncbi:glycosyltransferase [Halarchaeum sp. P4]|uniref:glycosyltransferase n=1 Tax=Halarchaeum sp. P4 TaxID=3421639 RepID=UPI003EBF1D3B